MKGTCSEQNCPNVVYRRGLCRRHYEQLREAERRENDAIISEALRKTAWRDHLPPVVHTPQEELDARALYCGNREREIFRRGRAL